MEGYLLYRKDNKTSLVITTENDDELFYLLRKLERTRVKWLKQFAIKLLIDFSEKISGEDTEPPVKIIYSSTKNL